MHEKFINSLIEQFLKFYYYEARNANSLVEDYSLNSVRELPQLEKSNDGMAHMQLAYTVNSLTTRLKVNTNNLPCLVNFIYRPEFIQYAIESKDENLIFNNADVAHYAYHVLKKAGLIERHLWLWDLFVGSNTNPSSVCENRTICCFNIKAPDGIYTMIIDSSTIISQNLIVVKGEKDQVRDEVLEKMKKIHKTDFSLIIDSPSPFDKGD